MSNANLLNQTISARFAQMYLQCAIASIPADDFTAVEKGRLYAKAFAEALPILHASQGFEKSISQNITNPTLKK